MTRSGKGENRPRNGSALWLGFLAIVFLFFVLLFGRG